MSMLLEERMLYAEGELMLGGGPLDVGCQLTVEWLRGIPEPTWYGYLVALDSDIRILPGRYRLRLRGETVELLVRRPASLGAEMCFPFWGLGPPPHVSEDESLPRRP
jgi:hypothetical protein